MPTIDADSRVLCPQFRGLQGRLSSARALGTVERSVNSAKRPCCLKSKSWSNRCLLRFISITGMRQLVLDAKSSTCCHSYLRACSRPKLHSARYKQFTAYTQRVHTKKRRCYGRVSAQTDNGGEKTPPPAAATPTAATPRDDDVRLLLRSSFRRSSSFLAILPSSAALQVLPDSLGDALQQASDATALAIEKGANRCIVSCCTAYHSCPANRISCQHGFEHFLTSGFALRLRSCYLSSGIPLVDQSLLRKVISSDFGSSPAGSLTALHRAETARTSKL